MKNLILLFAIMLTLCSNIFAQGVSINATGASADTSAILDVSSTTKGFLPPRMTEDQKNAIYLPAAGLLIYQTNGTPGLYYYNGTAWSNFVTGTHYIGEAYCGGKVFWVDPTGQHGLIGTITSQASEVRWYAGTNTNTMARGNGIYAGKMNTALIIASQGIGDGNTYAARICAGLVVTSGGVDYGDWYLPSDDELTLLMLNSGAAGIIPGGDWFCSSTESDNGNIYRNFQNGLNSSTTGKNDLLDVHAIRSF